MQSNELKTSYKPLHFILIKYIQTFVKLMTILNVYSKEQTDAKLEHIATTITDKTTHYEIDANSAVSTGANVPAPTSQDVGKFLKVDENADLVYAEGGGSGSGGLVAHTFNTVEELYTFLSQYFTDEISGRIYQIYNVKINQNPDMPNLFMAPLTYLGTGWETAYESHFKAIIITIKVSDIFGQTDSYSINSAYIMITLKRTGSGYTATMWCEGVSIDYTNGTTTVTPISEAISGDFETDILPYLTLYTVE